MSLGRVRERIAASCARVGRDPAAVTLVAVTKTIPVDRIVEAKARGQLVFGENRVQEALGKMHDVGPEARWHLVGHLQRNKARHAVGAFEMIHSVDDAPLAIEIDRRAAAMGIVQRVLVQVNLSLEATKSGAEEGAVHALLESLLRLEHVDPRGLMTIPPAASDPEASRPWFARLRSLRDEARDRFGRDFPDLSMGMTDDFEIAIEEGATLVRVGRAIFGERP